MLAQPVVNTGRAILSSIHPSIHPSTHPSSAGAWRGRVLGLCLCLWTLPSVSRLWWRLHDALWMLAPGTDR